MNNSWLYLDKYKELSVRSQRQVIESVAATYFMQLEEVTSHNFEGANILLALMSDYNKRKFIFIPGIDKVEESSQSVLQSKYFEIELSHFFEKPNISSNNVLKKHIKRDIPHHTASTPPLLIEVRDDYSEEWELEDIISPKEIADSPKYLKLYQDVLQSSKGYVIKPVSHIKQEKPNSLAELFCPSIVDFDPADEVDALKRKYIISDNGLEVYIHTEYTFEASIIRLIRSGYAVLSPSELNALYSNPILRNFQQGIPFRALLNFEGKNLNFLPRFIRLSLDEEAFKYSALNIPKFSGVHKAWTFIAKAYELENYETVIAAYTDRVLLNKQALTEEEKYCRIERALDSDVALRVIEAFEENDFHQLVDFFELLHITNQSEDKDYYHYYLIGSSYNMLGVAEKAKLYLWLSLSYKFNCASAWRELANIYRKEENKDGYYFCIYQLKISMPHMRSMLNRYLPKQLKPPYDFEDRWGSFYESIDSSSKKLPFFNETEQDILILGFALNFMQNQGVLSYFTRSYYKFQAFEVRSHKEQYQRILSIISTLIESRFVYDALTSEELAEVVESANACRNILIEAWDIINGFSKSERDTSRLQTLNNLFCIYSVGLRKMAYIHFSNALYFEADKLFDKNYSFSKTYLEDVNISSERLEYISSLLSSFVDYLTSNIHTYAQIKATADRMAHLLKKALISWGLNRHEFEVVILSFTHDVGYILKWFNILIDRFELLKGLR